jgi:hypothetical protein
VDPWKGKHEALIEPGEKDASGDRAKITYYLKPIELPIAYL